MYKVFIDTIAVYFVKKGLKIQNIFVKNPTAVWVERDTISVVFDKVLEAKQQNIQALIFEANDLTGVWEAFCSNFQCRVAAGGVVINNQKEVLMIFRNEKWDLPKGHLEKGETIAQCAVREVEEECGIRNLELVEKIIITYHTYPYKGEEVLKENHWFLMRYTGNQLLKPQLEEGITKVEWKSKKEAEVCLQNSYGSIKDVFQSHWREEDK